MTGAGGATLGKVMREVLSEEVTLKTDPGDGVGYAKIQEKNMLGQWSSWTSSGGLQRILMFAAPTSRFWFNPIGTQPGH